MKSIEKIIINKGDRYERIYSTNNSWFNCDCSWCI